jgi:mannose-6-phosphate isomerase-like protein (cupin superfamily)
VTGAGERTPGNTDASLALRMRSLVDDAKALMAAAGANAEPFCLAWPQRLVARRAVSRSLPVLGALEGVERFAAPATRRIVEEIAALAPSLEWRQTYSADDFGERFLESYGWTEWIGQRGMFESDAIACGVLLLGPDIEYPAHSHEAEEIYLPLAGSARWRSGDAGWRVQAPGACIHHPSWTPHAMRTAEEPLLALYVWRGGDLAAKSRIEN